MSARLRHLPADILGLSDDARGMLAARPRPPGAPDWTLPSRAAEIRRPPDPLHEGDRAHLSATLERELGARGAHVRTLDGARALARPDTWVVATAIRPRPFGGRPAELVRVLQTARLADSLSQAWDTSVVPLVWLRGDDHELGDVNHGRFLNESLGVARIGLSSLSSSGRRPLSALVLREDVHRLGGVREALRQLLWRGPFRDPALELCMPRAGETLVDAAWRALEGLVGELGVVVAQPAWLRDETSHALAELVPRLPRVPEDSPAGERPRLWHLEQGLRQPLYAGGEGFRYAAEPGSRTAAELAAEIVQEPGAWSPADDLLAPVLGRVLPLAAEVIDWDEVPARRAALALQRCAGPLPAWVPRVGLTLVDADVETSLARLELDLADVLRAGGELPVPATEAPAATRELRAALERAVAELHGARAGLSELDRGLGQQLKREIAGLRRRVERVALKADRALSNRSGKGHRHERRLAAVLMPGGRPQEGALSLLGILARHGTDWIRELAEELDPYAPEHLALYL